MRVDSRSTRARWSGRRRFSELALALPVAVAWVAAGWTAAASFHTPVARARPVPIGRYVEIPYGVSADHPYPTFGGDAQRTGRTSVAAPRTAPILRWEARLSAGRPSTPAVAADGTVYVGSSSGLAAVAPDGTVAWNMRVGSVAGTPSLTPSGDVAFGTHAGALLLVSPIGEIRSRSAVGGPVRGSPLILADGSIVVSALNQAVHRFDADGRRIFRTDLPFQTLAAPAWDDRAGILVPAGGDLYFLRVSGGVHDHVSLGATIVAGPLIAADGTIWILTQDGALHGLERQGRIRSRTELGEAVTMTSAIAIGRDGAVRVSLQNGVVCVGPNGTVRWRVQGEGAFDAMTLGRDDVLLSIADVIRQEAGGRQVRTGQLVAIGPNGGVLWRVDLGTRADVAPVLGADGTVYIATTRATVQAWAPAPRP